MNTFMKVMAVLVLIVLVIMPTFGLLKGLSKPSWIEETSNTTIISEEIDKFSEIEIEETTALFKLSMTPEEKIEWINQNAGIGADPSTIKITEVTVIEKETTEPRSTETTTALITNTTEYIIKKETTTIQELELKPTEKPTEEEKEEYVSSEKYSTAATVWNYLRNLGYSKVICAGILGNMMAEVGGQTLALEPFMYDDGYYGLCQWSLYYNPNISGASLEGQLDFLANTIKSEMNNFGYKYYNGFGYNAFLRMTDIEDATLAFAMCYERCASWAYSVRVSNAYTAYDYFA